MIPFDVSHFYSITRYTIAGLFAIGIITGVACFVIYLFNSQMKYLVPNRWLKYAIVAVVGIALIKLWDIPQDSLGFSYVIIAWLVLFFILLDIEKLSYDFDFFAPQMVFWAVFICLFSTGVLQYFNYVNEKEERLRFAEAVVQQRDDIMAYTFKGIAQSIKNDVKLKDFLLHPQQEKRRSINERFDALYLGGHLNRYQSKVLLYDAQGNPLFNNDTASMQSLLDETEKAEPVTDTVLYYKEQALNGHYYLAHIPITLSGNDSVVVGHLFIDFMVKESGGESVYPELLQPGSVKGNQNEAGYYYGVYVNNRLITQTSEYAFPMYLDRSQLRDPYVFYDWRDLSELYYIADEAKTVIVVRVHRLWLETITLFSYIFGVQMLLIIIVLLYRTYLSYFTKPKFTGRLINLTLRRRIHYSLLGVVLVSFLIIGIVTIIYSTLQYQQSSRKKLQLVMRLVERTTHQYLKDRGALENNEAFENEAASTEFQYFVTSLANAQKIDINVFNATGLLKVTSQENIYDKALLARIMQSDAYYMLALIKRSIHIQEEQVGRLTYSSCYVPIWADNGSMLGFLNIPYFSSEKELSFQISNILVALINLYAFIFLVSSLLTVFITRWLTRTLSIVINRFERLSLTRNELIDWPYEDEIGMLVKEYNKMVRKVEENAAMLARNEREGAWREMAQQVAHEIKNPLTPMKLNIQYLQQALKNDYPNVKELAAKVSESLIEQIDNLSYIASEFSNFAKMPEAVPEEIELNDVLSRTVELYLNEQDVKVIIEPYQEPLSVYADRSQLLRVFTNLIENAVQAIPEGRAGKVIVTLIKEDNNVLISFADNGVGIPADTIEKIFQPYFTTKTSGTGLGLAMTKKIIEFWKGSIWFETEEGKGTAFYIRMPLYKSL
jgi:two-component system, NtrC family, nitrogen regulation sensor histidine kinase NtrY